MDHQHTLQLNNSTTPSIFRCSLCKEKGSNDIDGSFICENRNCDHIIHTQCSKLDELVSHHFFKNSIFKLCEKAPDGGFCDVCGKDLLGVFYWCAKTNYALHPCCLQLPNIISFHEGEKMFKLCHQVPSDCAICNKRHVSRNQFEGWSYLYDFSGNTACFHVSCFWDMMYNNDDDEEPKSKGRTRSVLKLTGKLAMGLVQAGMGDFSSIFTIGGAIFNAIDES